MPPTHTDDEDWTDIAANLIADHPSAPTSKPASEPASHPAAAEPANTPLPSVSAAPIIAAPATDPGHPTPNGASSASASNGASNGASSASNGVLDAGLDAALDAAWMHEVFKDKDASKREQWLAVLHGNEFSTVRDLTLIPDGQWGSISLPLAVTLRLRDHLAKIVVAQTASVPAQVHPDPNPDPAQQSASSSSLHPAAPPPLPALRQLDLVVMDISGSMKSRCEFDPLKTREDISKVTKNIIYLLYSNDYKYLTYIYVYIVPQRMK